jgi:hypothetical protein
LTGSIFGAPWRFSNPRPHGNNILDLAIRNDVVWQVGERGRLYTSPDLERWMPHETGTFRSLRSITFFGTDVFISGEEGTILSGPTANSLTIQNLGTPNWLEGIAASEAAVVAVGDNGSIYSSANGTDWTQRGNFTNWLRSVAFGDNQFVSVGEDGFIARSTDGQNWERLGSGSSEHLNKVAWLNDRFWVVGDNGAVLTNNFRMTFTRVPVGVTNTLFTVTANSNEVVIAGDSVVLLGNLTTGTWTPQADSDSPVLAPLWPYYSALWDGRLFLLGGHAGQLVEGFRTNSTAPLVWYSEIQPTRSWLWAVTRAPEFYAAVGANGTIVTSEDGLGWDRETVPAGAQDEVLLGIGGNTNVLIAVGSNGTVLRSLNTFTNVISTNTSGQTVTNQVSLFGIAWESVLIPSTADFQGVAEKDGLFVITGAGGSIFTSTDGLGWLQRSSPVTSFLSGVTAWPGGFVAVGAAGAILTSENGSSWVRRNSATQNWIYSVRYTGGKLIAVGETGLVLTSDDGIQWLARSSGTTEWLNDITYARGFWQVAGSGGMIASSTDATSWSASKTITANSLYGAATDGEQIIMVGIDGMIIRKRIRQAETPVNIISYDHVGPNSVFLFGVAADQQFVLEESSSVTGPWYPSAFLEMSEPGGVLIYEKTNDDSPMKFFRTRLDGSGRAGSGP